MACNRITFAWVSVLYTAQLCAAWPAVFLTDAQGKDKGDQSCSPTHALAHLFAHYCLKCCTCHFSLCVV